jgi:D-glycero-D-manno-heptose 1,7-bisphosphate phosphatase
MPAIATAPVQPAPEGVAPSAIFLDRDGIINRKARGQRYITRPSEFVFLPGAVEALACMAGLPSRIIVVTNQRGIAVGRLSRADLDSIHEKMLAALAANKARVDAVYVCPHDVGMCQCRKPKPGLFVEARADFPDINPARSLLIGDSASDMQAGAQFGCQLVLVGRGRHLTRHLADCRAQGILVRGSAPSLLNAVRRYVDLAHFEMRY